MGQALRLYFKQKTTIVGIVTMLFFQLVFALVWMNGYDRIMDRLDQVKIGVLNEDAELGQTIAENVMRNLPFEMAEVASREQAQELLNSRELKMVIRIPGDFSAQLKKPGGRTELEFLTNDANPVLLKSVTSQVTAQVSEQVEDEVTKQSLVNALGAMQVPPQQAQGLAEGVLNRVETKQTVLNTVSNYSYQMVPMMTILASYVGSMLLSMQLNVSSRMLQGQTTPWQRFGARQAINVFAALFVAAVVVAVLSFFDLVPVEGYGAYYGVVVLTLLSFLALSQLFLYLFGDGGMLFNIVALSLQLVTSGVLVPRELLSHGFQTVGAYLPASYATIGSLNTLFGGTGTGEAMQRLVLVIVVCLVLTLIGVFRELLGAKKKQANAA